MNTKQRLAALDAAGEALKAVGEDYLSLSYRRADEAIVEDCFIATVRCEGKPLGMMASAASPSAAVVKALADRADWLSGHSDKVAA